MKLLQRWKQTAIHNKALVWTGVLVAFGTLFYAAAACFQIYLMKSAANDAAKQTEILIGEIRKQSKAMQDSAEANKKAVKLADQSIKTTQGQFRLDQRAWITIKSVDFKEPLHAGENGKILFTLNNTGKTPALRVVFYYKVWEEIDRKSIVNIEDTGSNEFYYGPGDERYITVVMNGPMIQSEIDGIHNGKIKLFINFDLRYFDIYETKQIRHTRTCYQYMPVLKKFVFGNRCSYMD